jgi:DNA-binding LacI/PurR family transcriptional regulator
MSKYNYKNIYLDVKKNIEKGVFSTNSLLPTEQALSEYYSVSRPTISKVYNQLQTDKYVIKKKGLGTIVLYSSKIQKTYKIGLLLPGAGESEIFSLINDRILHLSESMHFICLWDGATASDAEIRRNLIESCCQDYLNQDIDGIIFSPLERVIDADEINQRICDKISNAGVPIVLIDRDITSFPQKSPYDLVCLDNYSAGHIMAKVMIDAGCKYIHFFYRPFSAYSVTQRLHAIKNCIEDNGIEFSSKNAFCGKPEEKDFVRRIPIVPGKTGIICANDATAAVLMTTIEELGYKIGMDVLISGFDNMKYSSYLKCSLTTFIQPCAEIADMSVELLMGRLKKESKRPPITVTLEGKLITRDSTHFV